ncbi:MAG: hypothetical protein ACRDR6_29910 [Pseudonocardiaceae bacterium]
MRDVAPDGSTVRGPTTSPDWVADQTGSHHTRAFVAPSLRPNEEIGWNEFSCREPVLIPDHAQAIFAAHRAYRVRQGATDADPYFAYPREPQRHCTERILRGAIRRTCHTLGIDPPWMHGGDCRYGADIGLTPRRRGWMIERGVSLLMIDPDHPIDVPRPPRTALSKRVRPAWITEPHP